jgi:hypothetical protein
MSVTKKPLPGADSKHFLAISYPLDWEKTHLFMKFVLFICLNQSRPSKTQNSEFLRPSRPDILLDHERLILLKDR